eukprot:CAMPEP_0115524260 /NCGR_PEP_ID=MMETSP0271-20121206/81083_1 /TAXON_ID=71861 /ORGANISM="Scrippsiella trochoidea, Strain CCMP3099" /LENGTH=64 /DNA_ID=CAMNT_0002955743 /DNA_START=147 /DNA_END=338 /DNA_ORIENTATION=-
MARRSVALTPCSSGAPFAQSVGRAPPARRRADRPVSAHRRSGKFKSHPGFCYSSLALIDIRSGA